MSKCDWCSIPRCGEQTSSNLWECVPGSRIVRCESLACVDGEPCCRTFHEEVKHPGKGRRTGRDCCPHCVDKALKAKADREAKIAAGQEVEEEEAELMHSPGQRRIPSDPDSRVHRLYVAYHHLIKPHARKAKKQFPNRENWDLIDDLYHDEFIKALFRWVPRPGEPDERFENFCNTHLSQAPGRGRIPKDKRWLGGRGERIDDKDYWATLHSIADREISVRPQPPPAPVEEILAHLSPDDSKVIRMRFGIPPYERAYEWKEIQTEMGFKDWQNGQDVIRRAKAKLTKLYPQYRVWGDYEDQETPSPDPSIVSPHTPASLTQTAPASRGL